MTASLLDLLHLEYDDDDLDEGIPDLLVQSPYYSNEDAIQVLNNKENLFNLISLNCQSLSAKLDQLQVYIDY